MGQGPYQEAVVNCCGCFPIMCGAITLIVIYLVNMFGNIVLAVELMKWGWTEGWGASQIIAFIPLVPGIIYLLKFSCGSDSFETRKYGVTAIKWIMFHTLWILVHYFIIAAVILGSIGAGIQYILSYLVNFVIIWWWLQAFKKYV